MSVTPSPIGGFAAQFFDNNGVILSGGKIYTYAAGTTTPQTAYTSVSGATPHANPIILDSAGRVPGGEIWLTDGLVYKFVIETAASILIGTYDNITGVNSNFVNYTVQEEVITATAGQTVFNLSTINYTPGTNSLTVYIDGVNQYVGDSYLETDSDTVTFTSGVHVGGEVKFTTAVQTTTGAVDASIVSYEPPFTGSVATNVEAKLAQYVSVKDFGAVGDGVTDDTAAIQAALDASASVYFPEGVYALSDQIELNSGQKLHGDGYESVLLSTGTNKNIVYGDNVSHIEIASLFFQGNATGTGTAGHGIRLETVLYINIHDCYFDGIGNTTGYAGNISGDTCSFAIITQNIFLGASGGSQTGADIGFGYFGKQCLITNNISYSNQDAMVSLAAVGVTFRDNENHVVSNNIGIRRDINTSRSGIIITYNDEAAYTSVTGNILYNWIWNGIYIQSATSNTERSGGLTIQGNVVRYCGGDNASIGSGIYLSGNNGLACTGNLVEYTCYDSSEVYRGNPNDGIRIQNSASNISVVGNVIREGKGAGASLQPLTGFQQRDIVLSQNVFEDNEGGGIAISPSSTGTIKNLILSENIIKQENFDAHGIQITSISGAVAPENLLIEGNIINGVSGSTRSGISTNVGTPNAWVIRGNLIDTFDKGFECATFPADQLYGTACILDGNTIKNCTTGYAIGSAGVAFNGYVFNPIYINVTTKHASANYCDAVNIGNSNIELRRAAAPGAGTWRAGDRVTYLAPTAGGFIGAVCVSAGAPGTWKTFGAITP